MNIQVEACFEAAVLSTRRVCELAGLFGLGLEERRFVEVLPRTSIGLEGGEVIFVTGASGGGKSTLLREIGKKLGEREHDDAMCVIDFEGLVIDDEVAVIDGLGESLEAAARYLALAGLNEAFVMMRRGGELSDGQRYRYRLALAMESAEKAARDQKEVVVLADEFGSTLDRLTAKVLGRQVAKWARGSGVCVVLATTHDDLLESLSPETLIVQEPGCGIAVYGRAGACDEAGCVGEGWSDGE